jgi:hypothetical protein
MLSPARMIFPHRHNEDGSYDSICTLCLATVASMSDEDELTQYEETHACNLARLSEFSQNIVRDNAKQKSPSRRSYGFVRRWLSR